MSDLTFSWSKPFNDMDWRIDDKDGAGCHMADWYEIQLINHAEAQAARIEALEQQLRLSNGLCDEQQRLKEQAWKAANERGARITALESERDGYREALSEIVERYSKTLTAGEFVRAGLSHAIGDIARRALGESGREDG